MMLQGVQFRFLFFIRRKPFAARFLTFEFSSPKSYKIVSSAPIFKGGRGCCPAFFLRPGLGGTYEFYKYLKIRGLNVERGEVKYRGDISFLLCFFCTLRNRFEIVLGSFQVLFRRITIA